MQSRLDPNALLIEDSPERLDEFGPVFIIGCPRSGTTFLSSCLAACKNVEAFNGLLVSPRLLHLIASEPDHPDKRIILLSIRDLFWQSFWRRRFFGTERLSQLVQGNMPFRDALQRGTLESSLFLYKEPFICFAVTDFARHFPNSKFLHIIRDGRDNADSMERSYPHALSDHVLRSEVLARNNVSEIGIWRRHGGYVIPWWVNAGEEDRFVEFSQYERCVILWREMTERGRALAGPNYVGRYLELKYEELVTSPLEVIDCVMKFIGRRSNAKVKRRASRAFRTSIGVAEKRQGSKKIMLANDIAGELLDDLGYKL